ncbi:TRAP transporter substrate-binding protein [Thalassotalea sp. SU-HH00458]|uniref:TRAP transporter substrate-binding protein n=1 Tax=Thalassotalea sp. SU-HH00458 TaxID=3127657 RepID=UPI0031066950
MNYKVILTAFILALAGCDYKSNVKVLRVGHTLDTKHVVHQGLVHLAEKVEQYSEGKLKLRIYPSGQLGSERQLVELLQIGSLAITKVSAATLEGFVDDMRLFGLPYVFSSRDHRWQVLESDIGHDILQSLNEANISGLGYFDAGSRSFYICDKPISSPEDISGLKIRVMNSRNAVNMVDAFGGSATPISWGELYAALQQGVVDGAENNPPSFYSSRHYEICNNYTLNEHTSIPDVIIASKHIVSQLSAEENQWLSLAMNDAVEFQKGLWLAAENNALAEVKKFGVNVVYPDKKPFMDAVSSLHDEYKGTVVGEYLTRIKRLENEEVQ